MQTWRSEFLLKLIMSNQEIQECFCCVSFCEQVQAVQVCCFCEDLLKTCWSRRAPPPPPVWISTISKFSKTAGQSFRSQKLLSGCLICLQFLHLDITVCMSCSGDDSEGTRVGLNYSAIEAKESRNESSLCPSQDPCCWERPQEKLCVG